MSAIRLRTAAGKKVVTMELGGTAKRTHSAFFKDVGCMNEATIFTFSALCEKNGKLVQAEKGYRLLLSEKFSTDDFRVFFNLSKILIINADSENNIETTRLEEIIGLLEKCIHYNPACIAAYSNLAALYIRNGLCEAGCVVALQGIEMLRSNPNIETEDSLQLWTNMNIAYRQCGRTLEAILITNESMGIDFGDYSASFSISHNSIEPSLLSRLTICCVKYGTKYDAAYVNSLFHMIQWHSSQSSSLRFVCYTEDTSGLDERILALPFAPETDSWHGWWRKAQIFQFRPQEDSVVIDSCPWQIYIDLDTIIFGDCRELLTAIEVANSKVQQSDNFENLFLTLDASQFHNENRPRGINSSIIIWHRDHYHWLYRLLVDHFDVIRRFVFKFDHFLEMALASKIAWSQDEVDSKATTLFLQDYLPTGTITDYHAFTANEQSTVNDEKLTIVCFPLQPKPHQLPEDSLLCPYWRSHTGQK